MENLWLGIILIIGATWFLTTAFIYTKEMKTGKMYFEKEYKRIKGENR